jgi:peroxiredoxin Q/BCP
VLSWLFSEPLTVGAEAPSFTLPDEAGHPVSLDSHRGRWNVVLVFYPGDDTMLCTKQVCEVRDHWTAVEQHRAKVYGINPASAESHRKFREKYSLPFPILVDEGQRVAKLYSANGLIVKRTVYLIGLDGRIRFARRGMPPPREVLAHAD